jgi:hypothetical protein
LKNRKGPVMMERFYEATRLSTDWKGLLWTVAGACWDESWEALPTPPPFSYTTACLDQFIQRFVIPSSVYIHYIIQHLFILNLRLFPSQTKLPQILIPFSFLFFLSKVSCLRILNPCYLKLY